MAGETTSCKEIATNLANTIKNKNQQKLVKIRGCVLPERYLELENSLNNAEVMDKDIWICSFPRTGSYWISEMAWLILNDLDYEGAKTQAIFFRVPFHESEMMHDNEHSPKIVQDTARFWKTHLPWHLLPNSIQDHSKTPKIIYITRNPLDTCISNYFLHLIRRFSGDGTLDEYCQQFISDQVIYSPFWDHVKSYWQYRDNSNVLFLKYEDVKRDLTGTIRKMAQFLDKTLTDEQILTLEKYLSFDSMKQNPAVNFAEIWQKTHEQVGLEVGPFWRSGQIGNYRSLMPSERIHQFQKWMQENLQGTGLEFSIDG